MKTLIVRLVNKNSEREKKNHTTGTAEGAQCCFVLFCFGGDHSKLRAQNLDTDLFPLRVLGIVSLRNS